jgi:hypothetical protein
MRRQRVEGGCREERVADVAEHEDRDRSEVAPRRLSPSSSLNLAYLRNVYMA